MTANRRWLSFSLLAGIGLAFCFPARGNQPAITGIYTEGTNLIVTASVPPEVRRITLETSDRLGRHSWVPRVVSRPDLQGGALTFRLPLAGALGLIRVRADASEALPASFYQGTNAFSAPTDSTAGQTGDRTISPTDNLDPPTANGSTRAVVESDIWQIRGQTLYFFNHYRGLQVIDIAEPDHAFVRGTLEMPAVGQQMYLLGSEHLVLLAQDGCNYDHSQVVVVADTNRAPVVIARLPVQGNITESRLVGTALYVASQTTRPVPGSGNSTWEWGTLVSAFDLSNPNAPLARNTLWYHGYGNVVTATDTYLFVVTQSATNWWQSVVNLVDVTDPAGTIAATGAITTTGQIFDKFKVHYAEGIFAAISEDWRWLTPQLVTRLETFNLPDPRSAGPLGISKLGELELGHGERLHATRFDGNRVYVVTFFQIDPLWVVDFSAPAMPRIAGSLNVPGWSTYIEPLGDRLVALGVETNHVAVSLFDVANPATPKLLSRVKLGANYSWSEANYDEKAFTVLPEAGLLLVPFSSDTTNGYSSVLQLIDYNPSVLTARGQVQSQSGLSYRRAAVVGQRILSLTDWELVSVNAADRDNPLVTGRLELAIAVDRLLLAGDYLLELSAGTGWNAMNPALSVAPAAQPSLALQQLSLLPLPLLGATIHNDRLYLAQGTPGEAGPGTTNAATLALTVITLTNLPSLSVLTQSVTNTGPLGWSTDWQALWPKPDVLVWAGGQNTWWVCGMCPILGGPLGGPVNGPFGGPVGFMPPYWRGGGGNGHLLAFDATNPDAPRLASQVNLTDTNRWSFSRSFLSGGLVYLSHQTSEFTPGANYGTWKYYSYLDVVDFTDSADPLVRPPVSLPNPLLGVSEPGPLLYSLGSHWGSDPTVAGNDYLDASAYDGVAAHLVSSLELPASWPHPALVLGTNVLVGNPGQILTNSSRPPALETWTVSSAGKFVRFGSLTTSASLSGLFAFPGLVAATSLDSSISLFNTSDPTALHLAGAGKPPFCWWWPDLSHADGSLARGLWIPLNAYGVASVPTVP